MRKSNRCTTTLTSTPKWHVSLLSLRRSFGHISGIKVSVTPKRIVVIFILQSVKNTLADYFLFQWANYKIFGQPKPTDQFSSVCMSYHAPLSQNTLKYVARCEYPNSWLTSLSFVKMNASQAQLFLLDTTPVPLVKYKMLSRRNN